MLNKGVRNGKNPKNKSPGEFIRHASDSIRFNLGKGRVFSHIFLDAVMSCQILRIPDSGPGLFTSPLKEEFVVYYETTIRIIIYVVQDASVISHFYKLNYFSVK